MGASARTLPADEIAVGGGDAALARSDRVAVHRQAHRAAGLAPFEAGIEEDAVEPFGLGLALDVLRARHHPGPHMARYLPALGHHSRSTQVRQPAVGAGADEHP